MSRVLHAIMIHEFAECLSRLSLLGVLIFIFFFSISHLTGEMSWTWGREVVEDTIVELATTPFMTPLDKCNLSIVQMLVPNENEPQELLHIIYQWITMNSFQYNGKTDTCFVNALKWIYVQPQIKTLTKVKLSICQNNRVNSILNP